MGFILAKKILQAHPHGFVGAIVEGKRGVGKSSYCIKVMKEIYQSIYDCNDDKAYEYALKYIVFKLDDLIGLVRQARVKQQMIPVLTWDDAGVHGSNLQWFINMHGVQHLRAVTDTIRTGVTGFVLNCPDKTGLLKNLRNYDDLTVQIIKSRGTTGKYNSYSRIARGYNQFKLPSGTVRIYKNFEDDYSCHLPNHIYEQYNTTRQSYLDEAILAIEDMKHKVGRPSKHDVEELDS